MKMKVLFLISGLAALGMFLSLSTVSYVLIAAGLAALILIIARNVNRPTTGSLRTMRLISVILTLQLAVVGYKNFYTTWVLSSRLQSLAESWGTSVPVLLQAAGGIGCLLSLYALNVMSCWAVTLVLRVFKKVLPEPRKREIIANLKRNWFFPISAVGFFAVNATVNSGYENGMQIGFLAALIIASQIPSMKTWARKKPTALQIISLATAVGVCTGEYQWSCIYWNLPQLAYLFHQEIPIPKAILIILNGICAAAAVWFVFLSVLAFWEKVSDSFRRLGVFQGINGMEWAVYGLLLAASLGMMIFAFSKTNAFYGAKWDYDIIYTSDSTSLVKENAYLVLTNTENDLRQPLFALFAAPFAGIPYLISALCGAPSGLQAMLMNGVQVMMLYMANLMLTRMLKLRRPERICFMAVLACTYTQLLFTLMMEQYIVAYFWLVFCVYQVVEKGHPDRIALWGAGGTLLTSMVFLPFMSGKSPVKNFRAWFADTVKYGLEFIMLLLVFCRFDVIYNLVWRVEFLQQFVGENITVMDKLSQYTVFIRNCFLAPSARIIPNIDHHISWQLSAADGIHLTGVLLLLSAVLSLILNYRKKSAWLAAGWIGFSVVIHVFFGWGIAENGLILYSLYFGWAYFVLLFQLLQKIEEKTKTHFLIPVVSFCAAVYLLAVNIPAVAEMMRFAMTYYPV